MWGTRNARPLMAALWPCRDAFVAAAAFSFFINLLMLASPIYMMQIYNRVLPSRSEPTLIVLSGLAAAMLAVMCLLALMRYPDQDARAHQRAGRGDAGGDVPARADALSHPGPGIGPPRPRAERRGYGGDGQGVARPRPGRRAGAARLRHRAPVPLRRRHLHAVRCAVDAGDDRRRLPSASAAGRDRDGGGRGVVRAGRAQRAGDPRTARGGEPP